MSVEIADAHSGLFKLIEGLRSVHDMRLTTEEGWRALNAGLLHRRTHMDSKTRDPVLQHIELVESLLSDPHKFENFFMDGNEFRVVPGGTEVEAVVGSGPYRRLSSHNDAYMSRALGLA